MSDVIDRAIGDRERALSQDLVVPFRSGFVRITVEESARIVKAAARRIRRHNTGRKHVEGEFFAALQASWRGGTDLTASELRQELWGVPEVRAALERMWPVLTPAELLHDLFGSRALLRLAGRNILTDPEIDALFRPRSEVVGAVRWTPSDVALLDDAREVLGPAPRKGGRIDDGDEIRTYGHIVVDEVQDLSPMQLKMVTRRSLNGSLTVVGDLAQATGPWAPTSWGDITSHLPDKRPGRIVGLSVGYRIPAQIMQLADRVMHAATPDLRPPRAVREGDAPPRVLSVDRADRFGAAVAAATNDILGEERRNEHRGARAGRPRRRDLGRARRRRHRPQPGDDERPRRPGHGRADQRRQGPRDRRRGRRRAGPHRVVRDAGDAGVVRRAHPPDAAAHDRALPAAPDGPRGGRADDRDRAGHPGERGVLNLALRWRSDAG